MNFLFVLLCSESKGITRGLDCSIKPNGVNRREMSRGVAAADSIGECLMEKWVGRCLGRTMRFTEKKGSWFCLLFWCISPCWRSSVNWDSVVPNYIWLKQRGFEVQRESWKEDGTKLMYYFKAMVSCVKAYLSWWHLGECQYEIARFLFSGTVQSIRDELSHNKK